MIPLKRTTKRWMGWLACWVIVVGMMVSPSPAAEIPDRVVGRVSYIEGDLLRYVPEEKDWAALVVDAPFGTGDTLFSGNSGRAELIVPNGTWIRTGKSTQIQFIALETDLAEMDVSSGMARFSNKGPETVIKVTTPFGYVLADPGTIFDFYVGENAGEVVAVQGTVRFFHSATDARYDAVTGSSSILADPQQVSFGDGTVNPEWNRWNMLRENFWLAKSEVKGASFEYLPPNLRHEAYTFEENGSWELVPYEGTERWFWRPTKVAVGWSPFTMGRWTDWYGDQTWIPAEPFGYTTHHYGNWIYANRYWYWAPPVVNVRIGLPLLDIGFFWSPGRVSWIYSGLYVGWVPLAPRETYYSHRHWGGPHTVVISNVNMDRIHISIRDHSYTSRAIIIPRDRLYDVNQYSHVRVRDIHRTTLLNQYRAAPEVSRMISNYSTIKQRHNFTNTTVKEKPHPAVIQRIRHNETMVREGRKEPLQTATPSPTPDRVRPAETVQPRQPAVRPAPMIPSRPGQSEPARPERVTPAKPSQAVPPAATQERMAPEKPGLQEKRTRQSVQPNPGQERVTPVKPSPRLPPAATPESVTPPRPAQPERSKPERIAPEKPVQKEKKSAPPEQSSARRERIRPTEPVQPGQPNPNGKSESQPKRPIQTHPEHVAPAKAGQTGQPVQPGDAERTKTQKGAR